MPAREHRAVVCLALLCSLSTTALPSWAAETLRIGALPDHAGSPPLHAELHQRLGPIERVWQESDGDLLLKPLGVPAIWSLECDTDFGTLDLVKCDRSAERIRIQTGVRTFSANLIRGGLAEFQTNDSLWRIHSENRP